MVGAAVVADVLDPAAFVIDGGSEEEELEVEVEAALVDWKRRLVMRDTRLLQVHGSAVTFISRSALFILSSFSSSSSSNFKLPSALSNGRVKRYLHATLLLIEVTFAACVNALEMLVLAVDAMAYAAIRSWSRAIKKLQKKHAGCLSSSRKQFRLASQYDTELQAIG